MAFEIGFCKDCRELNYAITNRNGVFDRANMSNNHFGHRQIIFGKPETYSPPIRVVLTKLQAGLPISTNEMILFTLALDLEGFLDEDEEDDEKRDDSKEPEKTVT